jgi:hypothetical protein
MRHCESPNKIDGNKCPMALPSHLLVPFRAAAMIDRGLVTMQDLDAWTLEAVEHIWAERERMKAQLMAEQKAKANG